MASEEKESKTPGIEILCVIYQTPSKIVIVNGSKKHLEEVIREVYFNMGMKYFFLNAYSLEFRSNRGVGL